jgi:hypothetical protein
MSWNELEILAERQTVLKAAQAMLAGTVSYIEGVRQIVGAWRGSKLDEWDADFLPFVAIESETETLPFGEMRKYWQAAALEALQPEIERSEAWAKEVGEQHCMNIVKRLSDDGSDRTLE